MNKRQVSGLRRVSLNGRSWGALLIVRFDLPDRQFSTGPDVRRR